MNELERLRRRLKYTAARRAKLEVEEYLRPVLEAADSLSERELKLLLRFLQLNDMDLWDMLMGRRPVPRQHAEALSLIEKMRKSAL